MHDLATFALAVLVRSGAVAAAALLLLPLLRRAPAHVRHALLVASLVACAIVPFFRSAAAQPPLSKAVALPPHSYTAQIIAIVYLLLLARAIIALALAWRTTRLLRASASGDGPVYRSARVTSPVTIGAFRPMILLPADEQPVPDEVLAHEMAHVRRRDALLQSVLKLVLLPVACHPLVRMLERRAAVEREIACDEAAASTIGDRLRYARTLVAMAGRNAMQCGVAFGPADALERRLRALRERGKRHLFGAIAAAVAIAAVAVFIARLNVDVLPPARDFSGRWTLDRNASEFGRITPYDRFTNTLIHDASALTSRQVRVQRGRTRRVNFRVETDGVTRPIRIGVVNGRGRAGWSGDTLVMELSTSSGHYEVMRVALAPDHDTLVTDGTVRDRGGVDRFRFVFRRDS